MLDRRELLLWGLLGSSLTGCASSPEAVKTSSGPVMWPVPPEQPRFIYQATLRDAASLRGGSHTSRLRQALTGEDDTKESFGKPFAVAARRGRVYVSDTESRRIYVFDLARRTTFSFGTRLEGELRKPAGLTTDAEGRVYVVDATARRVVIYDALGLYLGAIDGQASWSRPTAVAVTPDGRRIHVVDTGGVDTDHHRVWIYGDDGKAQGTLGKRGGAQGEFNLPADMAIAPDGTLWVLDAGNFRVQAFDAHGKFLRAFGSVGNGLGQFSRPRGLAVDGDGLVYVCDAGFCNIQVFQPDGTLLLAIGARARDKDAPGRYLLPAKIATDERGHLFVVDQFLHKVEVLRRLSDDEGKRILASTTG